MALAEERGQPAHGEECDVFFGVSFDCNFNNNPDECDVFFGTSADFNFNGVPDECEF